MAQEPRGRVSDPVKPLRAAHELKPPALPGDIYFLLSVPIGDESPVIVSGIAFQDVAERIAKLGKGDALSVAGSLKPSMWEDKATGEERHGLNITVSACLSPYDAKMRRGDTDMAPKPETRPQEAEKPVSRDMRPAYDNYADRQ